MWPSLPSETCLGPRAHLLVHMAALVWIGAATASSAVAQSVPEAPSVSLDEGYGDAFLHYQSYLSKGKKPVVEPKSAAPTPSTPPTAKPEPEAKPGRQKVDVAWLRKNYPLLQDRAIDDPSDANVAALYYVQRVLFDKAQRYEESAHKVVTQDPLLNENNRIPYASSGAKSVANASYLAEQQAVRELASIGGLMVFVDGACRFCAAQLPITSMVRKEYGIEYLVISIDGTTPKGYKGAVLTDNGLFKKLGLKLTPSIVFVPRPKAYPPSGSTDPNSYLIVSQGYYAADTLIKQIAFAGHTTKLLSKATMADLDVWDRGVASSKDLGQLTLDVNKPEDIKSILQPLLFKQY